MFWRFAIGGKKDSPAFGRVSSAQVEFGFCAWIGLCKYDSSWIHVICGVSFNDLGIFGQVVYNSCFMGKYGRWIQAPELLRGSLLRWLGSL